MNKLDRAKRIQVLNLLCEGMSMRAASRVAEVSYNTVCAILAEAGAVGPIRWTGIRVS